MIVALYVTFRCVDVIKKKEKNENGEGKKGSVAERRKSVLLC